MHAFCACWLTDSEYYGHGGVGFSVMRGPAQATHHADPHLLWPLACFIGSNAEK